MDNQVFNRILTDLGQISTKGDSDWSAQDTLNLDFLVLGHEVQIPHKNQAHCMNFKKVNLRYPSN